MKGKKVGGKGIKSGEDSYERYAEQIEESFNSIDWKIDLKSVAKTTNKIQLPFLKTKANNIKGKNGGKRGFELMQKDPDCEDEGEEDEGDVGIEDVVCVSRILLGIIGIKFKRFLHLNDDVQLLVANLIHKHRKLSQESMQEGQPMYRFDSVSSQRYGNHSYFSQIFPTHPNPPQIPPLSSSSNNSINDVDSVENVDKKPSLHFGLRGNSGKNAPQLVDKDLPYDLQKGKSKVMLFKSGYVDPRMLSEDVPDDDHDDDDDDTPSLVVDERAYPIPVTEEFLVEMQHREEFRALEMPFRFLNLHHCIRAANMMAIGVATESPHIVRGVLEFLSLPPQKGYYCTGKVKQKTPHTYTCESQVGPIQIGIPPETIKHSMKMGEDIPKIYVLPPALFSVDTNRGDVEFPIYFNFFVKKAFVDPSARIMLIGSKDDLERVKKIFRESFYGPNKDECYESEEISTAKSALGYSIDLQTERNQICEKAPDGGPVPIENFMNCVPFSPVNYGEEDEGWLSVSFPHKIRNGTEEINVTIENKDGLLQVFENNHPIASVDINIYSFKHACTETQEKPTILSGSFEPPVLGITFLGTSHGFDPHQNTSGFVLWINGQGILVDPPATTSHYLKENGIPPNFVTKCILSHCHSDHDSGLLMKILEGDRLELFTTKTIHESYKRKMKAVTGLDISDFYDFTAVPIGEPVTMVGAEFEFDYAFHTIPTLRFRMEYCGRSVFFSGDTLFDPVLYRSLGDQGVLHKTRETSLCYFGWDADLIIHESGVPPIHTPIHILNDLPRAVKRKMFVVHCQGIPEQTERPTSDGKTQTVPVTHLVIPKAGLENTVTLDVGPTVEGASHATRRFKMFCEIQFFQKLSPATVFELFSNCTELSIPAETIILNCGDPTDKFYVIFNGKMELYSGRDRDSVLAVLHSGDVFGESALRRSDKIPRNATVIAMTDSILLSLSGIVFRKIIERRGEALTGVEEELEHDLSRLNRMRPFVKEVLSKTFLFQNLTEDQISCIAMGLEQEKVFREGQYIIHENDSDSSLFLIEKGEVKLTRTRPGDGQVSELMRLGIGDVFGELSLITGLPRTASVLAISDLVIVLELKKSTFDKFTRQFQNLRVKLASLVESRLKETVKVKKELIRQSSNQQIVE